MNNIEKRLENTEYALVALWNLVSPSLSPEVLYAVDQMLGEYFDANKSLGTDFDTVHVEFHKGDDKIEK